MFQTNFIFQTKRYMLSVATIFLLLVSMLLTGTIPAEALTRGTTPLFTHGNRIIQVIKNPISGQC